MRRSEKIRFIRTSKGLTQKAMADLLKVSLSEYRKAERDNDTDTKILYALTEVFKIDILYLIDNKSVFISKSIGGLASLQASNQNQETEKKFHAGNPAKEAYHEKAWSYSKEKYLTDPRHIPVRVPVKSKPRKKIIK